MMFKAPDDADRGWLARYLNLTYAGTPGSAAFPPPPID